ncbi:MAG TPA: alpha/beta hydrolase [Epulopiscium sp.]|nr:alpha/beta hydrolase [Candidatus Epulonipiscium sp.]
MISNSLFLHGGPGDAMLPVMTGISKDLEDDFIVVNWEQRGAGKSYYPFKKSDEIDVNTFIFDTYELTNTLLKRFSKEKIYIMGTLGGQPLHYKLHTNIRSFIMLILGLDKWLI